MEKEREKKSEKEDSYFDPDGTWKGLAVVITNFLSGPHIRKGAEKDPESMKKSFEQLGFKVICHEDVTKPKLLTDLLDECKHSITRVYLIVLKSDTKKSIFSSNLF